MLTIIIIIAAAIVVNYLLCTIFQKEIGIPEAAVYNPILAYVNGIWQTIEKYILSVWQSGSGKASLTRIGTAGLLILGGWVIVFTKIPWIAGVIIIVSGVVLKVFGEAFNGKK